MDALLPILRCPATGSPLSQDGAELVSEEGARYPVVDGVPVLVSDDSVFTREAIASSATQRSGLTLRARLIQALPTDSYNIHSPERFAHIAQLARANSAAPRVLVVGGGQLGKGMEPLVKSPGIEIVHTDVYLSPIVDVACDGHSLPFADESFDAVVAQAVLEHVADPHRVVAEMHRVLRPGGVAYAETPFMQQVHEGAYDFTRFTELGHRRLFRYFEEIDRGAAMGPATALLWSLRYFARSLPPRRTFLVSVLDRLVTTTLFWIKYLDRVLIDHPGGRDAASGVYFLGRKAEEPISDRELVASYDGANRSAAAKRDLE